MQRATSPSPVTFSAPILVRHVLDPSRSKYGCYGCLLRNLLSFSWSRIVQSATARPPALFLPTALDAIILKTTRPLVPGTDSVRSTVTAERQTQMREKKSQRNKLLSSIFRQRDPNQTTTVFALFLCTGLIAQPLCFILARITPEATNTPLFYLPY